MSSLSLRTQSNSAPHVRIQFQQTVVQAGFGQQASRNTTVLRLDFPESPEARASLQKDYTPSSLPILSDEDEPHVTVDDGLYERIVMLPLQLSQTSVVTQIPDGVVLRTDEPEEEVVVTGRSSGQSVVSLRQTQEPFVSTGTPNDGLVLKTGAIGAESLPRQSNIATGRSRGAIASLRRTREPKIRTR